MVVKRKLVICSVCFAVVTGALWLAFALANPKLIYKGKDVQAWSAQLVSSDRKESAEADAAFRALGSNAVPPLIELIQAHQTRSAQVAAAIAREIPGRFGEYLTQKTKPPDYETLRYNAGCALVIVGTNAAAAVPSLAKELGRGREPTLWQLGRALAAIGQPSVPALIDLTQSTNKLVRHAAALGVAKIGPDASNAVLALLPLLNDEHEAVRTCALAALGNIGTSPLPPLLQSLETGKPLEQKIAAQTLIAIRPSYRLVAPRLFQLSTNVDAEVRSQALEVLGSLRTPFPEPVAAYARALKDPEITVRIAGAKGLYGANLTATPYVKDLIICLDSKEPELFDWCARALARIGAPAAEALPILQEKTSDDNERVRRAANEAVSRIRNSATVKQ